jgi:hypothetical protein
MKSLNMKLALSAIAIAMLATPALAQRPHHQASSQRQEQLQDSAGTGMQSPPAEHYPNGDVASGSADAVQSGAQFNLGD